MSFTTRNTNLGFLAFPMTRFQTRVVLNYLSVPEHAIILPLPDVERLTVAGIDKPVDVVVSLSC